MSNPTAIDQAIELMRKLIACRYDKPLHHQLMKVSEYSMLGVDVLILIHHMARTCEGGILEIGSFLGASTVSAGLGARASGTNKKFISVEPGGRLNDHRLATKDIFRDLTRNVARAGLRDRIDLINGSSFDETTIKRVKEQFGPEEVGLFIFDADWNVRRDIDCYSDRLASNCWVVIDDYVSATEKGGPIQTQVDEMVTEGRLMALGLYGWGTWIGRWQVSS